MFRFPVRVRECCIALLACVLASLILPATDKSATSLLRQCNRMFEKGRFREAVACYSGAIDRDPQNPEAFYNRALAGEMLDRAAALSDWRRFLALAGSDAELKPEANRITARIHILESKPAFPATLQPGRYEPKAGDYYALVAQPSEGLEWTRFPVKVFLRDEPQSWRVATEEALRDWASVIPLQTVNRESDADIILIWEALPKQAGGLPMGAEVDRVYKNGEGGVETSRPKVALVSLSVAHRWSVREMHSTALHEIGHALGIQGHSDSPKDVMFPEEQETVRESRGGAELRQGRAAFRFGCDQGLGHQNQRPRSEHYNSFLQLRRVPGAAAVAGQRAHTLPFWPGRAGQHFVLDKWFGL